MPETDEQQEQTNNETNPAPANQEGGGNQAAEVDVDAIVKQATEAVQQKFEGELSDDAKRQGITEEQLQEALKRDRQRIASMLTGEEEEAKQPDPIISTLAKNPAAFVDRIINMSTERIRQEQEEQTAARRATQEAIDEVLVSNKRQDILEDNENQVLFNSLYNATDDDKSEKERMQLALEQYDRILEKNGAGKAEERIQKALGVGGSSAPQGGEGGSSSGQPRDRREILQEEQKAKRERFKRARKGRYYLREQLQTEAT